MPLRLWNRPHWELKGRPDAVMFFRVLQGAFADATTLFLEGTRMADDVRVFFNSVAESGPCLPDRQTIWPRPSQYRFAIDDLLLARLAELAASHAEPELLDHIFVYAGSEPLIEYPDAFFRNSLIFVSRRVPEEGVRWFAN